MSLRTLIAAMAGVAVLAAGAAQAQQVIASKPVPNPPAHAHKTVIVKHRHGHKIIKVVHHHRNGTKTVTVKKKS